jgi:hydantoinase/carbamoylase family amidase
MALPAGAASVVDRLRELALISAGGPGVNRPGYGPEERAAHGRVALWMEQAGLHVSRDNAGNLHGRRDGTQPSLPPVWVGSHLDTVPQGGPLDGAYGVVGGLAALVEAEADGPLPCTVEVVAFCCEEAARFGTGLLGSRGAVAGLSDPLLALTDRDGVSLGEACDRLGIDVARARDPAVRPTEIGAFLELHIEQGPVLERAGAALGAVTAIAAPTYLRVTIEGEPGHAGTTPMEVRRDALTGGAEIVLAAEGAARGRPGTVATVGSLTVRPGASNVVPGWAELSLDLRSLDPETKAELVREVTQRIHAIAAERSLLASVTTLADMTPVGCDARLRRCITGGIESVGELPVDLPSGAYHDAMSMAAVCPVGMLFVPSMGGRSHVPDEWTDPAHLELGVRAFARAIRSACELAESTPGGRA